MHEKQHPTAASFGLREQQMVVYESPARFRVLVAGRRFGKTQLALAEMLRVGFEPKKIVWYIGPSYPQSKHIVWERLKNATRPYWKGKPSETELSITLFSGSVLSVRGADRPDSLRGSGIDFAVMDEFASMRPETWTKVIRPALSDRNGRALFLGTPQGCNHFFDLYEHAQAAPDWAGFKYSTAQGGNVRPDELRSAASELDADSFKQEFEAAFTGVGRHQVYYAFDRAVNVQPSEFQPRTPLIWSIDFNVDPMCMLLIQRNGSYVNVFDEIILKPDANTNKACEAFLERTRPYMSNHHSLAVEIYGDSSGNQRRTSGTSTDWTIIRSYFSSWRNAYLASFHTTPSNPGVRDRVNCVNSMLRNVDGEAKLFIDPKCKELIKDLEQVAWQLDASGRPTTDVNKSDRERTHASDALGYYIAQAFPLKPLVGFKNTGRLI